MNIKDIFLSNEIDFQTWIKGWIVTNRGNKNIRFIELNDGSTILNIQLVIKNNLEEIEKWTIGSAINVYGKIIKSKGKEQDKEIEVEKIELLSLASNEFPIQKNEINLETLRENLHVRHRTTLIKAVMLIRSTLSQEIHSFFRNENFLYMHSPILTSNDGEGAGETFIVNDSSKTMFFNKQANLAVTGQLHAESYALGFKKVYTFGPTFRAEHSNTTKHAAEFWMIEPEVSFYKLADIIKLADRMLKYVIKNTIDKNKAEFKFLDEKSNNELIKKLNLFLNNELKILDYKEAINVLEKVKNNFENKDIFFGMDLNTEHEKYLANEFAKGPIAIINYPKEIKAFYMHLNEDNKTVAAFDLLVPGIGELIGGSQRENSIIKLKERLTELKIDEKELNWYIDLRKFGNAGSSGFGLGFERLVMYVCGIENIRDSIPYPRTTKNIKM
ncbi:MAG: asparagine--tRNA ligase [Metamycoplasmataceae bacterium]